MDFIKEGNMCNSCRDYELIKREKKKELAVKTLLKSKQIQFVHDTIPPDGCGRARPDFTMDCGTHVVLVEVDEFQHRRSNYPCECEQVRTINLFQEFGGMKVVFIRYNPDSYTDKSGKKQRGNSQRNTDRLIRLIEHTMKNIPDPMLCTRYICFDGDDGTYEDIAIEYETHITREMASVSLGEN
jgi:hypothetical protein